MPGFNSYHSRHFGSMHPQSRFRQSLISWDFYNIKFFIFNFHLNFHFSNFFIFGTVSTPLTALLKKKDGRGVLCWWKINLKFSGLWSLMCVWIGGDSIYSNSQYKVFPCDTKNFHLGKNFVGTSFTINNKIFTKKNFTYTDWISSMPLRTNLTTL